ncbi:hypothetical protein NC651_036716 [Populus alba x Populus x berolinensis]|nr:hypothetical protein NC651_036716 [Populus alba x Populus x berolinensis]
MNHYAFHVQKPTRLSDFIDARNQTLFDLASKDHLPEQTLKRDQKQAVLEKNTLDIAGLSFLRGHRKKYKPIH